MTNNRKPNRLVSEKSPYLLQHAYNPVNWFPWSDEAFDKARTEDKPVFLSVGYSTCHWCHVMAHESFEDADVAALLNRDFISVKVDREERPDIDGIYMRACQAMTGSGKRRLAHKPFFDGGWQAFFCRHIFPKSAFIGLLESVGRAWKQSRPDLLKNSERMVSLLGSVKQREASAEAPVAEATETFRKSFDREYGGFGQAPKFPAAHNLMLLLHTAPELAEENACADVPRRYI